MFDLMSWKKRDPRASPVFGGNSTTGSIKRTDNHYSKKIYRLSSGLNPIFTRREV